MGDRHWQLEGMAAEVYERYLVPAITGKWAEDLLDRAKPHEGEAVLDVACGTGIVARLAAKRMVRGQVTGLDLNAGMLAVARSVPTQGASIIWIEGSALDLPFASDSFDVVLSQLGLQFFQDQRIAVGEIVLSVYSGIEQTPGANAFVLALDDVVGEDASRIKLGEHSFTDPTQLETLLRDSGFDAVDVQTVEQTIVFPSVLDYVRFQLLATPTTILLKDQTEPERHVMISLIASKTRAVSTVANSGGRQVHIPTAGVCRDRANLSLTVSPIGTRRAELPLKASGALDCGKSRATHDLSLHEADEQHVGFVEVVVAGRGAGSLGLAA